MPTTTATGTGTKIIKYYNNNNKKATCQKVKSNNNNINRKT